MRGNPETRNPIGMNTPSAQPFDEKQWRSRISFHPWDQCTRGKNNIIVDTMMTKLEKIYLLITK